MNKLDGLSPKFRGRVEAALERMGTDSELKALGVQKIIVVEGLRPLATQMAYYSRYLASLAVPENKGKAIEAVRGYYAAAGLYKPGDKESLTPNTWTLKSRHLDGLAVDLAPSRDGKTIWWAAPPEVWARMGLIGQSFGLEWGGTWKGKADTPHFQMQGEA